MKNNIAQSLVLLFLLCGSLFGSAVTHYGAMNVVNDAVHDGNTLYLATGGGLLEYDLDAEEVVHLENAEERLEDVSLVALYLDGDGTMWAGSALGYFYRKTSRGQWTTYQDFYSAGAIPNKIIPYNNEYLLIAHSMGISVFSVEEEQVVSTASTPGVGGEVFDLLIVGDTLFASVDENIVKLDSLDDQLLGRSFRNKLSWENLSKSEEKVCGLIYDNGVVGYTHPALAYRDTVLYGKSVQKIIITEKNGETTIDTTIIELVFIEVNGEVKDSLPLSSEVTSITLSNSGEPVVTTAASYSILDPFGDSSTINKSGVVFGRYQKIQISSSGDLWLISTMSDRSKWYEGITRFDGEEYHFYNDSTPGFGKHGDLPVFKGLAESEDGRIWFGNNGQNIKVWNPSTDSWSGYIISCRFDTNDSVHKFTFTPGAANSWWQKSDAIARDSSGNMWFTLFAEDTKKGASRRVAIFNPTTKESAFAYTRRDGEDLYGSSVFNLDISTVLSNGDRLFATQASGEYFIIPASVNPFTDNIEAATRHVKKTKKGFQDIVSTENGGNAIVATLNGLYVVRSDVGSIDTITISGNKYESNAENYLKPISSVVIEKCQVQRGGFYEGETMDSVVTTTFWASVQGVGVERFVLREYIKNNVSSPVVQTNDNPVIISSANRPFLDGHSHLAIDKINNYLWIAGENGLTRYQLGYSVEQSEGKSDTFGNRIYPNPYSKMNHEVITIDNLSPNSFIDIYTLSGNLIAHFDSNNSESFSNSGSGKIFSWTPPSNIAPGTYLVAMKDSDTGITDIKKLVIIP